MLEIICAITQNVNSGSVFLKAMGCVFVVQGAGLVQSALQASDILDTQNKPVFCVFHTNLIGVTAVIQLMRSMVHLNHCFLSSQTSWHHTSKETNVKLLNYFIPKPLQHETSFLHYNKVSDRIILYEISAN